MTSHQTGKITSHWNDPASNIFLESQTNASQNPSRSLKKTASSRRLVYEEANKLSGSLPALSVASIEQQRHPSLHTPPTIPSKVLPPTAQKLAKPPTHLSPQDSLLSNVLHLEMAKENQNIGQTGVSNSTDITTQKTIDVSTVRNAIQNILEQNSSLDPSVHAPGFLDTFDNIWLEKLSEVSDLALQSKNADAKAVLVNMMCSGVVPDCIRWCPVLKTVIENLSL
ncbi:hypothetical protein SPOG_01546 [Schizosaccharomyces cryophilus OY26]|uniref:Uncharacterized protein n=1 Tax=Schizosaccharomyces cryophilus (strain OY26 / ATCC MYA-4695 / CBS 11777 / NBRC 106824 / NRRL Y48691) TaxID=653667 RepID=S9VU79_SCHCR|nr:uncharacterized protein SPOG_01546 [Schizosaccharomyces cryophilus OY26]EPY49665.1 hypothetical protein SPOG_01546 [Schizosaccharomyces cryophilus OY26]